MVAGVDHVLVPTDGSPLSRAALDYAMAVHPTADLTLLYVIDYVEEVHLAEALVGFEQLHTRATSRAQDLLADAATRADAHEGTVRTEFVFGNPSREILEYADEHDVDLLVMGSHGRTGLSRALLGSVAQRVLQRAPVPVTIVR
ncbi:MAG: universal stress protein [Halorientalis sp.]